MAVIQYLDVILGAKTTKLDGGLDRSGKRVKALRSDLMARLPGTGFISGAASKFAALGPAGFAAAAGIGAIIAAAGGAAIALGKIRNAMGDIDQIAKSASQAGATYRELAGFRLAVGESSGLGPEAADKALVQMQVKLADAERSGNQLDKTLSKIGLNSGDLLRAGPLEAIKQISAATRGMKQPSEQLELAYRLFGTRASALVNTLRGGPEAIAETVEWADKMGLALGQAQAKQVENANDAWGRVQLIAEGVWHQIAAEVAPVMEVIADEINAFAEGFGGTQEMLPMIVDGLIIIGGVVYDLIEAAMVFNRIWLALASLDFQAAGDAIADAVDFGSGERMLEKVNQARQDAADAANAPVVGLEDTSGIKARIDAERSAEQERTQLFKQAASAKAQAEQQADRDTARKAAELRRREAELSKPDAAPTRRSSELPAVSAPTSSSSEPPAVAALQRGSVAAFQAGNTNERAAQAAAKQRAEALVLAAQQREELANIRQQLSTLQTIGNAG